MKWLTAIHHFSEDRASEKTETPEKKAVLDKKDEPDRKDGLHNKADSSEALAQAIKNTDKPPKSSVTELPSKIQSEPQPKPELNSTRETAPEPAAHNNAISQGEQTQQEQNSPLQSNPPSQTSRPEHHHQRLKPFFATLVKLLIVTGLTHLSWHGYISQFWYQLLGKHMNKVNQAYLTEARSYTEHLLEILTESKMVLSLLQSSSGGISFIVDVQLQVGETLSSLNDAVTYAWKISLVSLSAVEFLSLSLDLSHYSMTPALTLCFILLGLSIVNSILFKGAGAFFHKLTSTCIFAVLLTHFILPAAVFTSAMVSQDVFSKHRGEIFQSYSNLHSSLPARNHGAGLKDQVHNGINFYKDNREKMHTHTHHLTRMTSRHIIINMVEYLILPLLMVYLLSRLRLLFHKTG